MAGHTPGPQALQTLVTIRPLGLFCDLDGTLAPIAPRPEGAMVPPQALRMLKALRRYVDLLAIVSGRPLGTLRALVPLRGIALVGSHGLEVYRHGRTRLAPGAAPWKRAMGHALGVLEKAALPPETVLEPKGWGLAIHYRLVEDPEKARAEILDVLAGLGLTEEVLIAEGRRVVELRPRLPWNKGTAVASLAAEARLRAVVYLGDDTTDLDAFRALRQWAAAGQGRDLLVAVRSTEASPELLAEADLAVEGPAGALELLQSLEAALRDRL